MNKIYKIFWYAIIFICTCFASKSSLNHKAYSNIFDIIKLIDSYEICIHLSGEINGDGSENDKEVIKNMNDSCEIASKKYNTLHKKYTKNSMASAWLKNYNIKENS